MLYDFACSSDRGDDLWDHLVLDKDGEGGHGLTLLIEPKRF